MKLIDMIHPFISYAIFGTIITYLLSGLCIKLFYPDNPRAQAKLLFLPLVVPIIGYTLAMSFALNEKCKVYGKLLGTDYFNMTLDYLCNFSLTIGKVLTPAFAITAFIAIAKAFLSMAIYFMIQSKYGFATKDNYPRIIAIAQDLAARLGIPCPDIIVTSEKFAQSFVYGWRRPVVILSSGLIDQLDEEELTAVIGHELAHVISLDGATNWIAVFLRDLMFFVPITYWIFNRLNGEKEKAADDMTIRLTEKPLAFAEALVKVWRLSPKSLWHKIALDNFSPNPGFAKQAGVLETRLQRIVANDYTMTAKAGPNFLLAAAVIITVSTVLLFLVC